MEKKVFIAATEQGSGKSLITIGLIDALRGIAPRVGYMKPIGQRYRKSSESDDDASLIKGIFGLPDLSSDINPVSMDDARSEKETIFEKIFASYGKIAKGRDIVVIEGTDFMSTTAALEFDINAELAKNLGASVLLVANGSGKSVKDVTENIIECTQSFREQGCTFLGTIINRVDPLSFIKMEEKIRKVLAEENILLFGSVPLSRELSGPRLKEVHEKLDAKVLYQGDDMSRIVTDARVLAMMPDNALEHVKDRNGYLLITPGDRADIIFTALIAQQSQHFPCFSGIVLTGGLIPGKNVHTLISGLKHTCITVLSVKEDTYNTALKVNDISGELDPADKEKIGMIDRLFENRVDIQKINTLLGEVRTNITTPKMFQYRILEKAKSDRKRIVLPEGNEERIIIAASEILERGTADIVLIGNREEILERARTLGNQVSEKEIIDSSSYDERMLEDFTNTFYTLRKHKGVTREMARDLMLDPVYFATMMVKKGYADGFVSGTIHSTANTLRPALQIIKTKENTSIASSIFFMCMPDRVLVYGDCALVENPDAAQLADIAIVSAETARSFGITPYVAMLSYSTGESGKGKDVEKVREATLIARKKRPDLPIEGPLQYDAATSEDVAKVKYKGSEVAGKATVYIFPDLDAGNTAYKAVQRSANVPAIGPVIQGLNKPANDLSRGADVIDIVYTIAITAIQAQQSAH
jgi:phosphate acetyltransferase